MACEGGGMTDDRVLLSCGTDLRFKLSSAVLRGPGRAALFSLLQYSQDQEVFLKPYILF